MATVTIDTVDYDVYITVEEADEYLAGQISATAWRALTGQDDKARAIISATRLIDRQLWQGEKTDPDQVHAFPRTGLTYPDSGDAVDSASVPQEVLDATAELASALIDGSAVQDSLTPLGSNVQSLKAGSVSISYFRAELLDRFPVIIQELLGFWLAGAVGLALSISHDTDRESAFEDEYGVNEGI